MKELRYIKKLVEKESGVSDISVKTRMRDHVYARSVYFIIAVEKLSLGGSKSAHFIKYNHATQIHANKNHHNTYIDQNEYKRVYYRCCESYFLNKGVQILTDKEKEDYKNMYIDTAVVRSISVDQLERKEKYRDLMDHLYRLPDKVVYDFMTNRVVPYLQMKRVI